LSALADAGWDAREAAVIVGTSSGAVLAALLRAGISPADLHARVMGWGLSPGGRRLLARGGGWPSFPSPPGHRLGWPSSLRLWPALARRPWRMRPGLLLAGVSPLGAVSPAPIADGF